MVSNAILILLLALLVFAVLLPLALRVGEAVGGRLQGFGQRRRRLALSAARGR